MCHMHITCISHTYHMHITPPCGSPARAYRTCDCCDREEDGSCQTGAAGATPIVLIAHLLRWQPPSSFCAQALACSTYAPIGRHTRELYQRELCAAGEGGGVVPAGISGIPTPLPGHTSRATADHERGAHGTRTWCMWCRKCTKADCNRDLVVPQHSGCCTRYACLTLLCDTRLPADWTSTGMTVLYRKRSTVSTWRGKSFRSNSILD